MTSITPTTGGSNGGFLISVRGFGFGNNSNLVSVQLKETGMSARKYGTNEQIENLISTNLTFVNMTFIVAIAPRMKNGTRYVLRVCFFFILSLKILILFMTWYTSIKTFGARI